MPAPKLGHLDRRLVAHRTQATCSRSVLGQAEGPPAATNFFRGELKLVERNVGDDDHELPLPNFFKEPKAISLKLVVETSPKHGRAREDTQGSNHSCHYAPVGKA